MPRASTKAENANAAPGIFSKADPFASLWPVTHTGLPPPNAVDSLRRMSEVQISIARFTAARIRKDASTMAAVVTCRSPMDLVEVWRKAAIDAVTDYADEAARILDRAPN